MHAHQATRLLFSTKYTIKSLVPHHTNRCVCYCLGWMGPNCCVNVCECCSSVRNSNIYHVKLFNKFYTLCSTLVIAGSNLNMQLAYTHDISNSYAHECDTTAFRAMLVYIPKHDKYVHTDTHCENMYTTFFIQCLTLMHSTIKHSD